MPLPFMNTATEWTNEAIDALGEISDVKVAKMLGVCPATVRNKRIKLGITCRQDSWKTKENSAMLTLYPDRELADRWGVSDRDVNRWRAKLGKPICAYCRTKENPKVKEMGRRLAVDPRTGPTVRHFRSVWACLKDPSGVTRVCLNVSNFVRNNSHLFDTQDTQWSPLRSGGAACRASLGLLSVNSGRLNTWKGWTKCLMDHDKLAAYKLEHGLE